jgi:hypothetical protein
MIRVLIKGADDIRVAISPGEAVEHYGFILISLDRASSG